MRYLISRIILNKSSRNPRHFRSLSYVLWGHDELKNVVTERFWATIFETKQIRTMVQRPIRVQTIISHYVWTKLNLKPCCFVEKRFQTVILHVVLNQTKWSKPKMWRSKKISDHYAIHITSSIQKCRNTTNITPIGYSTYCGVWAKICFDSQRFQIIIQSIPQHQMVSKDRRKYPTNFRP